MKINPIPLKKLKTLEKNLFIAAETFWLIKQFRGLIPFSLSQQRQIHWILAKTINLKDYETGPITDFIKFGSRLARLIN